MKILKNFKFLLFATIITSIISYLLPTISVYYLGNFINEISAKDNSKFNFYTILLITLVLNTAFFTIVSGFLKSKLELKFNLKLNENISNAIANSKAIDVEKNKSGTYLYWIEVRAKQISSTIFQSAFNSLLSISLMICSIFIIFFTSWKLALIGLLIVVITFIFPTFLSFIAAKINSKFGSNQEKYHALLKNNFDGFIMLYYLNKPDKFVQKSDKIIKKWIADFNKNKNKALLIEVINSGFFTFANLLFFFLIGYFIYFNNLQIGTVFILPSIFLNIVLAIKNTIKFLQDYNSFKKYIKIFSEYNKIENNKQEILISKIEFINVSYVKEEKTLIKNFSFSFQSGKKYALIDETGNLKTLLINLILKEEQEYQGTILINDMDLKEIDDYLLKNSISFLNSKSFIFKTSIYNNVALWDENEQNKVKNALAKSTLIDFDIEKTIEKDDELSTGEKQRINFARQFYRDKKVWILNEAYGNIDPENAEIIKNELFNDHNLLLINGVQNLNDENSYDEIINLEEQCI
ncbi:ABC transporter ATP-binding protein [Mesomycoplasma lagogenitalium]|uniref:ABC transporter ATP-binding protein n=1 Tax=Mesomycoplasma lagogenitalium TaxID=171286 RepID=A0ABY8LUU5_9BACT|nr:ABC transporter ATP-binding protein [Mesomycoplasma lagogenitalium]WGI36495.1 ABC transporter ATP-binding protein [Mesomycoplasma lagogenitalium]